MPVATNPQSLFSKNLGDLPAHAHGREPENIAAGVFLQAFLDATATGNFRSHWTERDQKEAREFLLADRGKWATARAEWCGVLGVPPEVIRAEALRVLGRGQ